MKTEKYYRCYDCNDTGWVTWTRKDGQKIKTLTAFNLSFPGFDGSTYDERWVERCTDCYGKEKVESEFRSARKRNGVEVDSKFLDSIGIPASIIAAIKKIPPGSALLYGSTGEYKSIALEYWYNAKLKTHDRACILYTDEYNLISEFKKGEDPAEILSGKNLIFLDEILLPVHFRNQSSEGFYNAQIYSSLSRFWDLLYKNKNDITVYATSNRVPEDVISDENGMLIRRVSEVLKKRIEFAGIVERGYNEIQQGTMRGVKP